MAPNSEEDNRILYQNSGKTWRNDNSEKEPQRPPVYNPEDYAQCLKKWGKKGNLGMQLPLYASQSTGSIERISAEITKSMHSKRQSSPSTKSSASSKNGDAEKQSKKEKESTLKPDRESKGRDGSIVSGGKNCSVKDLKNPIVTAAPQETEMSLRQFSSVTELLVKLKQDLRLAFPSFVQEFVGDPVDGVTLLLELLRAVQLSQASQQQRCPPQVLRRALLDEHSCLVCLKHCLRCPDASRRLASSSAGLFTLAVCIMSNVTKSRIIALELLTKACEVPGNGHKPVSEALSTLRLRFGEPVRFRFLVGMLNSAGAVELLTAAMKFINAFISTAPSVQQKVYIQAELEQAGFDSKILRKTLPNHSESVKAELKKWEKNYFDVEVLEIKVAELESLRDKVQLLEKRVQILQEEKGILQSLEQCLKERCSELEEEVSIKTSTTALTKSTAHTKPFRNYASQQTIYANKRNIEKGESTPAEDEGISSSEQELSQDEDCAKSSIPYNITAGCDQVIQQDVKPDLKSFELKASHSIRSATNYPKEKITNNTTRNARNNGNGNNNVNVNVNNKMKETNVDDGNEVNGSGGEEDEEETTIDEVIEELRNIVNDAETEVYGHEKQIGIDQTRKSPKSYAAKPMRDAVVAEISANGKSKPLPPIRADYEKDYLEEAEIVPSGLLPQPPRRTRSLVHIFLTGNEYDDASKNEFFDDETDTESSDSLLTAAREKRSNHKNCHHRSLEISDSFNSSSSINTRTLFIKQQNEYEESEANVKLGFERGVKENDAKRKQHFRENRETLSALMQTENGKKIAKASAAKQPEANQKTDSGQERRTHSDTRSSNQREMFDSYEKTTSFQGAKACMTSAIDDGSPFLSRASKFVPMPVKRSQTFHIVMQDGHRLIKRTEMKPKPKMGVSGLDLQRNSENKIKSDSSLKYQNVDYKKSAERNGNGDRYGRQKPSKDREGESRSNQHEKRSCPLQRRGSLDGLHFVTEEKTEESPRKRLTKADTRATAADNHEPWNGQAESAEAAFEKKNLRSKSLEKMDDGLDSLVDIVFSNEQAKPVKSSKPEWNIELNKNIGPRMRRSLAESSLFTQPFLNNLNKESGSSRPPQPAQRTSLTRNNSSSIPLHMPVEIKIAAPVQSRSQQSTNYNFAMKTAKSESNLMGATPAMRYPPDGSSSPSEFAGGRGNSEKTRDGDAELVSAAAASGKNLIAKSSDESTIYAIPIKQSRLQKFFGSPKFENGNGNANVNVANHKYFESGYACGQTTAEKKSISPLPRNIQSIANTTTQKMKSLIANGKDNSKISTNASDSSHGQPKLNFFLGTYHQSHTAKGGFATSDSASQNSGNSFNSFLLKRGHGNAGMYSGSRESCGQERSVPVEGNGRQSIKRTYSSGTSSTKVTDSLSGLY